MQFHHRQRNTPQEALSPWMKTALKWFFSLNSVCWGSETDHVCPSPCYHKVVSDRSFQLRHYAFIEIPCCSVNNVVGPVHPLHPSSFTPIFLIHPAHLNPLDLTDSFLLIPRLILNHTWINFTFCFCWYLMHAFRNKKLALWAAANLTPQFWFKKKSHSYFWILFIYFFALPQLSR